MARSPSQRRAADQVAAWLAINEKNPAWLVEKANADAGTIGDFLNGRRWPKIGTQGKIERALGWPAGSIRRMGNGATAEDVGAVAGAAPVGAGVDPELLAEMADLNPVRVQRVKDFVRGIKAND